MSFVTDEAASKALGAFFDKVHFEPNTGCWLWGGAMNKEGYGTFWFNKKAQGAHRVAYKIYRGEPPKDYEIDHLCRVRCCVNPDHLEAVTPRENWLRSTGPELVKKRYAAQSHCKHGHPRVPHNLYIEQRKDGVTVRKCRECTILRERRKRAAKKAMQ